MRYNARSNISGCERNLELFNFRSQDILRLRYLKIGYRLEPTLAETSGGPKNLIAADFGTPLERANAALPWCEWAPPSPTEPPTERSAARRTGARGAPNKKKAIFG